MLSVMRHPPVPVLSDPVVDFGHSYTQNTQYYGMFRDQLQCKRHKNSNVASEAGATESAAVEVVEIPQQLNPFHTWTKQLLAFFSLTESKLIRDFLRCDKCFKVSDNYALSMVFIYFIRADFAVKEYTPENFFVALYLALDMEDDEEEFKFELFPWCLGEDWRRTYPNFLQARDALWKRMNFRALCSKATCDEIMSVLPSVLWNRVRHQNHAGAIRKYRKPRHPNNDQPTGPFGTPVPCCFCFLAETESRQTAQTVNDSARCSEESDHFFTADERSLSASTHSSLAANRCPANAPSVLGSNASSIYREKSNIFAEDDDDDEDDGFWHDAATTSYSDLFNLTSDEEEEVGRPARSPAIGGDKLFDIFLSDSGASEGSGLSFGETCLPQKEPQRTWGLTDLRDFDVGEKSGRINPAVPIDYFVTED